jgi:hypothetical protein
MPRKKDEKPTYDYNIYQISIDKAEEFKSFLEERKFEEIPLKQELVKNPEGFAFTLMFCDKDNQKGSPWVKLLSSCSEWDLSQQLKIYGATLICTNSSTCFVVSYGNAHFYVSNYCDYNFGISVAERLVDLESVRAQQNISHGSKLSKMHMDYFSGAFLSYRSGEIPTYIRGKSINKDDWGEIINCGTSAQFKWEENPLEIGEKLQNLETAINASSSVSLPRLAQLDDEQDCDKIEDLFQQLAKAIDEYDEAKLKTSLVNVPSFYMVGTKLVQNDSIRFKISCNYKRAQYDGELNIISIKNFLNEKQLNVFNVIKDINIAVEYSNDQWTNNKPLIDYIEFITTDNFCLQNGKWCSFNSAYMERILQDANRISFSNHIDDDLKFDKMALISFAKTKGIYVDCDKQPYETYYNEFLAKQLGAICVHPHTVSADTNADGRYKYEVCDLFLDGVMYFVKIGAPADFAYAVDQAMLTLDKIENNYGIIELPTGISVEPKEFKLVLIFENRKTIVEKWNDIFSINFLIHLTEIKQRLNNTDIKLNVDFCYSCC